MIESYNFGSMVVDGKKYSSDLKIFPDRIKSKWWREKGHLLLKEDIEDVIEYKPDILVIGTGANGLMKVDKNLKKFLEDAKIKYIVKKTKAASEEFNKNIGKKTVGVFHLTC